MLVGACPILASAVESMGAARVVDRVLGKFNVSDVFCFTGSADFLGSLGIVAVVCY